MTRLPTPSHCLDGWESSSPSLCSFLTLPCLNCLLFIGFALRISLSLSPFLFVFLSPFVFHRLCNFFSYRFSSYICLAFGSSIKSNQLLVGLPRPLFSCFSLPLLPRLFLLMFRLLFPVAFALTMHPCEAELATAHREKRGREWKRVGESGESTEQNSLEIANALFKCFITVPANHSPINVCFTPS